MKLETRLFLRGAVIFLLMDAGLALLISHFAFPEEQGAFWVALLAIWGLTAAVGLRRTIHRAVTLWAGMGDMEEYFRRQLEQHRIPAPGGYDVEPDRYLCTVADNKDLPEEVRFGAVFTAAEIMRAAPYVGVMHSFAMRTAASSALNKLRR